MGQSSFLGTIDCPIAHRRPLLFEEKNGIFYLYCGILRFGREGCFVLETIAYQTTLICAGFLGYPGYLAVPSLRMKQPSLPNLNSFKLNKN